MDQRLFHAASNGDVDCLLNEVKANPTILHAVALEGGNNPLHTACLAGHLNFAATVVKLRPQFSRELNQDGFSPLHIAAACGHGEVVKELLKVDLDLCLKKGKDRKIPLHLAVTKGNAEVVNDLLSSRPASIECATVLGETSLHLAVKNSQIEVFKVLIQHLKEINREDLLNSKDSSGNTILHLAVSKKQYEVVQLLLNGLVISKEKMELNSINRSGLTPLDMLYIFQSEAGDREIGEILIQSGAQKARNSESRAYIQETKSNHHDTRDRLDKLSDYFKYNKLNESPAKVRSTLLVMVTLITAATYQPVLSPPGGTWQDDYVLSQVDNSSSSATSNTTASKSHTAGESIMFTHHRVSYDMFLFANSVGFYMSLYMIQVLTATFPMKMELLILFLALATTYSISMTVIAPASAIIWYLSSIAAISLPFVLPIITSCLLRKYFNRPRNASAITSQERV